MRDARSRLPSHTALRYCSTVGVKIACVAGLAFMVAGLTPHAALSSDETGPSVSEVRQFAAPGSKPSGLAWDGKHLWLADDDTDKIYKLDPADGKVLASFNSPVARISGLTWDGEHLWSLDAATHKIHKLDRTKGTVLSTVKAPVLRTTGRPPELSGLAWDGKCLWSGIVAGWSSKMNQVDPSDGSVKRWHFTKGYPRALASDGTFIWSASDSGGKRSGIAYKYNLSNGLYVSQVDTPGMYPTGLACDGQYLWSVDRETRTIYRLAAN